MKKKACAVLALSAALALGAVPAFAADTSVGNASDMTFAGTVGTGSTDISVKTTVQNISVAVPIDMTVAVDANGGPLQVPGNYRIVNKSNYTIAAKVKGDVSGMAWTLGSGDVSNSAANNVLQLKLQPEGAADPFEVTASDSSIWVIGAPEAGQTEKDWGIAVSGTASHPSTAVGSSSKAVKLVYTVAPAIVTPEGTIVDWDAVQGPAIDAS